MAGPQVAAFRARRGSDPSVVVEAFKLNKWYGQVHALDDLSLQVEEGDVFGFLGPNGAGKTTFTKCMLGFIRPSSGQVHLFGHEVQGRPQEALLRVGIVPDQFGFYPLLTGRAHLDVYGRLFGLSARDREERVEAVTKLVRLENRIDERVKGYSHGMRQRLVIAQALLNEPDLIVFDEPTTGLDPKGAFEVRQLLKGLAAQGVTTFLSSHILHEVEDVCSKVAIMNRGVLLRLDTVRNLRDWFARAEGGHSVVLRIDGMSTSLVDLVMDLPCVSSAEAGEGQMVVRLTSADDVPQVVSAVVAAGGNLRGVEERQRSLEEMFMALTDDGQGPGSPVPPSRTASPYRLDSSPPGVA